MISGLNSYEMFLRQEEIKQQIAEIERKQPLFEHIRVLKWLRRAARKEK